ncbi:hypothetical protein [Haloarcula litorea]|uniref:hypothetical protein n=1 Tax=Haloarcula litorea TaxID=3032579 RepID=UPI0023E8E048|nr:hypothetical protein [Halomicroarcula sp. GDY20]
MRRRAFLGMAGVGGIAGLAGCGEERESIDDPTFRVGDDVLQRRTRDGYEQVPVRGVNLGMAKPGRFPGEAAITREEYDRWLAAIGEFATVVRTYTVHPPAFYRALAAHNATADEPLSLLQGTWVPTADLVDAGDATALSEQVDRAVRETVDAVHGATTLPERPGYASGTFDTDVSDALLGYLFGIEWPPEVVVETNESADPDGGGQYVDAAEGAPFERWLAGRLDGLAAHAAERYGTQRPLSFVNWVTTDPLEHPYEPFRDEDRVGIDPDAVRATDAFAAGTFASYHAYPYYPDLLNETPAYLDYVDHRGERNSYAGYLNDLVGATALPLVVAEFGVPSSRGIAHRHVHGRHQGWHTEREQGEILVRMFEDVAHAGAAGGIAFAWQNEWFKRTWNLDARSVPGRRPNWSNVETPEQRFGLLAFDPVEGPRLDGSLDGWGDATTLDAEPTGPAADGPTLTGVRVTHTFEGLAVRLAFDTLPDPVDWSAVNALVTVGLTGRERSLPFGTGASAVADVTVRLGGPGDSRLLVAADYDAFAREFGEAAGLPLDSYRDGSAGFVPSREPVNLGYTVPATGERVPFDAVETGRLRYGTGDPDAADYDSLTDVHVAADAIELRLPWLLLNIADPSGKRRIATAWDDGLATEPFEDVAVAAGTYRPDSSGRAVDADGPTNLGHVAPGVDGSRLRTVRYRWEPWEDPVYEERQKASYDALVDAFGSD